MTDCFSPVLGRVLPGRTRFRRGQTSAAYSIQSAPEVALGFNAQTLPDERSNRMLIPSMMGADVAGLRRTSLHEVFTHV
jgi:hypothetical protein